MAHQGTNSLAIYIVKAIFESKVLPICKSCSNNEKQGEAVRNTCSQHLMQASNGKTYLSTKVAIANK